MMIKKLLTILFVSVSVTAHADEAVNAKLQELDARTQRIERVVDNHSTATR